MEIHYNITHAFHPNADPVDNASVLRALIDCLITINMGYLRRYPSTPALYDSGVRYRRTIVWEPVPELYLANKQPMKTQPPFWQPLGVGGGKRAGDCKSLASALVAQYRLQGKQALPTFRWARRPTGALDFHILVQTDNGFEDPSAKLGMSAVEVQRYFQG